MTELKIRVDVEETVYEAPTPWRLLGGKGKARHVVDLCARHGIKPASLLEVGAGDGSILKALSDFAFCEDMHAVEISRSGVEMILGQNIKHLRSCATFDGYRLPFPDKSIDLIVLSHVLEHVEFERALLREIARVSKFQVIEIPMDCNALHDPVYHFLGPSYGHINAHSPDALRFLLSTENLLVLDEMLGAYDYEVQEYDYFVNNSNPRTPESEARLRASYDESAAKFAALDRSAQIRVSSFFAVLCRSETHAEKVERALAAIKACIDRQQLQPSRLIFEHYIPKESAVTHAFEIATYALDRWPRGALDYLGRIPAGSEHAAEAERLRERANEAMAQAAASPAPQPVPSVDTVAPQAEGQGGLSRTLPFLRPLIRRIRRPG